MKLRHLMIIPILLSSCSTPAYKIIYEVMPKSTDNPICYYKKLSDLEKGRVKCYKVNAKNKDGSYMFNDTLVIKKRAMRELLQKHLDQIFDN